MARPFSYAAKSTGDTIAAAHVNTLQTDVEELDDNLATLEATVAGLTAGALYVGVVDAHNAAYSTPTNGTADATTALQAALDAAEALGGGVVQLGPYTYRVGTAASLKVPSYVTLRGAGWDTVLQLAPSTTRDVIVVKGTSAGTRTLYAGLEDLVIDGNKANQSSGVDLQQFGIGWQWASFCTIRNVWVKNTQRSGIFLSGEHNLVENCYLTGIGKVGAASSIIGRSGIIFESDGTNAGHNRAINCRVMDCLEHGIKVYPSGHYSQIKGGEYNSSGDFGVWVDQANYCKVEGVSAIGNTEVGILVSTCIGPTVTGCTANDTVATGGVGHGIQYTDVTGGTIGNNYTRDNDSVGIKLTGSGSGTTRVAVVGNSVDENDVLGIYEQVGDYNNFVGNVCRANGSNSSGDNLTITGANSKALTNSNVT
jgi:parallel beta-helix repeat protein